VTAARSHVRPPPAPRPRRIAKTVAARDALAGFDHGVELDVLTFGQFSIMDAVEAILDVTGPADVSIATWTAAAADLRRSEAHLQDERIRSLRLIVDRSFLTRQPDYAALCVELFGADSIRTTRLHAKFVTVVNADWHVVIRTSMNLNENPRLEYMQTCDDAELCAWFLSVVDDIFAEEPPGIDGARGTPTLGSMPEVQRRNGVAVSRVPVRVGPTP